MIAAADTLDQRSGDVALSVGCEQVRTPRVRGFHTLQFVFEIRGGGNNSEFQRSKNV